ncbi:MAG: hypothetical protein MN733_39260, partial [Nitrososphaera sp.]|nr:hypothetical protein [Nitrososphaera sp.]
MNTTTLINHPRLKVTLKSGSEGPKYDPYHYDEYTITSPKDELLVHDGFSQYIKIANHLGAYTLHWPSHFVGFEAV